MPQIIDVPGYGPTEFPDGMDDAAIVKAIKGLSPTQETASPEPVGALKAGVLAAGRSTDKILDGLTQMYLGARGESSALKALEAGDQEKTAGFKSVMDEHPIATGIGGALPMAVVPIGGAVGATGALARSAFAGALPEALSYGAIGDRAKRAAVGGAGGAVGGALGLGVSKLLKPSGAGVAGLSDDAINAAERLGYKLTAGQKAQNPAMQNFENYLARSPGSSGAMLNRANANQTALNSAAARAMGQKGGDLSEGTFAVAKQAIGDEFARLQAITNPKLETDFFGALAKVDASNSARGAFKSKSIDSLIDKGLDLAAKNNLSGTAYKEIRTQISNDAQAAFKSGDATLGQAMKTIRNALDEAAKKSLSETDQKAWDLTRQQWAAYKALTKSNVSEGGNVSAARLAGVLRQQGDGLRTGAMKGPLSDVARLGESVKSVSNPNSGQLVNQMLYGNPLTGLPIMAGNKAAEIAYMNPIMQKYMGGGLLDIGKTGQLILGKSAGPLGAPAVQQLLGAQ